MDMRGRHSGGPIVPLSKFGATRLRTGYLPYLYPMVLYVFGNVNTSWDDFVRYYVPQLDEWAADGSRGFVVCDRPGVDTMALEFLKTRTGNVRLFHVGETPSYLPEAYRTRVGEWSIVGKFHSVASRDMAALEACTHFLAVDSNPDDRYSSATLQNIHRAKSMGKVAVGT